MSIGQTQELILARMMLQGALPQLSKIILASKPFQALKEEAAGVRAFREEARKRIDAAQAEANAKIDALQAEMDRRLDELYRRAEETLSDVGLESILEELAGPKAAPAELKPSSLHILPPRDPKPVE